MSVDRNDPNGIDERSFRFFLDEARQLARILGQIVVTSKTRNDT
jgi:hypothetical protein